MFPRDTHCCYPFTGVRPAYCCRSRALCLTNALLLRPPCTRSADMRHCLQCPSFFLCSGLCSDGTGLVALNIDADLLIDAQPSWRTLKISFTTLFTPYLHNKHRRRAKSHNKPATMDTHPHLLPMMLAREKAAWLTHSTPSIAINPRTRLRLRVTSLRNRRHRPCSHLLQVISPLKQ